MLLTLLALPVQAAVKVGGEVSTSFTTSILEGKNESGIGESLNLELLLPIEGDTEANVDFSFDNNGNIGVNKLYLEHHFDNFDLSMGRQPISWGFGSLLNPVDFNLGAEVMDEETGSKNVDAIEFYYPLDWKSSITLVTANTANNQEMRTGLRARTYFEGYDLSFNYVYDQSSRLAFSGKGDLGAIGAYTSLGYYFGPEVEVILLGGDYSFYPNGTNQMTVQLEYLHDGAGVFSLMYPYIGGLNTVDANFINAITTYSIDDFSSVSLSGIVHPEDTSMILIPKYQNQLGNQIEMTIDGSLLLGDDTDLFGHPSYLGSLDIEFSYAF